MFEGELPAARHRAIQLGMLHSRSDGFLELTPGTRPRDGRLELDRRTRAEHFLPAGLSGGERWLPRALYHAERILDGAYARRRFAEGPREEVFLGVAARQARAGGREHVAESRWLWVDVDDPGKLDGLRAFLAERPAHLVVESAGSGGLHCYWELDHPLAAKELDDQTGEVTEPIGRANLRLIEALGADRQCRDRGRVLRLAGNRNFKTGRWARISQADLTLAPYTVGELVGDLADPEPETVRRPLRRAGAFLGRDDPVHRVPPPVYFRALAGVDVPPGGGVIRCVSPAHEDRHPSMRVYADPAGGFVCWSCGVGGTAYDLYALVTGRPHGPALRDETFREVKREVMRLLGLGSTETHWR